MKINEFSLKIHDFPMFLDMAGKLIPPAKFCASLLHPNGARPASWRDASAACAGHDEGEARHRRPTAEASTAE